MACGHAGLRSRCCTPVDPADPARRSPFHCRQPQPSDCLLFTLPVASTPVIVHRPEKNSRLFDEGGAQIIHSCFYRKHGRYFLHIARSVALTISPVLVGPPLGVGLLPTVTSRVLLAAKPVVMGGNECQVEKQSGPHPGIIGPVHEATDGPPFIDTAVTLLSAAYWPVTVMLLY